MPGSIHSLYRIMYASDPNLLSSKTFFKRKAILNSFLEAGIPVQFFGFVTHEIYVNTFRDSVHVYLCGTCSNIFAATTILWRYLQWSSCDAIYNGPHMALSTTMPQWSSYMTLYIDLPLALSRSINVLTERFRDIFYVWISLIKGERWCIV